MKLRIESDYEALSLAAAQEILHVIINKPDAVLCLATGNSPTRTYQKFVELVHSNSVDIHRVHFVSLDEWVGVPPTQAGSCRHYLDTHLFIPLDIKQSHIHVFDGLSKDLNSACRQMNDIIADLGGIDLMLVGVGMNGHVGFNEPGVSPDYHAHVIQLEATTQTVGQKYFEGQMKLEKGITLGMQDFMDANVAIMVANGKSKAPIMKEALEGPVSMRVPASMIRNHKNGMVILDKESASALQPTD